ncbi:MAG: hypothetical protein ACOCZS_03580, partial [Verrucomicrobiota bacterium]
MDFVKQHFEKIIFGIILAGMLWYSFGLLQEISSLYETEVDSFLPAAEDMDGKVEELDEDDFRADDLLTGSHLSWVPEEDGGFGGGGVFYHGAYIQCVNVDCRHWLPYDSEVCPACGTEQGVEQADPGQRDSDEDGISDSVEDEYDFLDPQDPDDAEEDYDDDWFTNLEELEYGTDPADVADYPLLARNLQLRAIRQDRMDLVFKNIMGGGENVPKEDWDLVFNVLRDGSWKTEFVKVGEKIKGYEIKDVEIRTETVYSKQVNDEIEQNVSVVTLQREGQDPVTVERNKRGVVGKKMRFRFFKSAVDGDEYDDFTISDDEELILTGADGEEEEYQVKSVDADDDEIEVECRTRPDKEPLTVTSDLPREYDNVERESPDEW